jgi:hypothetical protein
MKNEIVVGDQTSRVIIFGDPNLFFDLLLL